MFALCWVVAAHAGVVINEFLPDAVSSDTDMEWLELTNNGTDAVDISSYKIRRATAPSSPSTRFDFASVGAPVSIAPGEFVLVAGSATGLSTPYIADLQLGNATTGTDVVWIEDGSGSKIDVVAYGTADAEDWSAIRTDGDTSVGPDVTEAESIGRTTDGADTNVNSADFATFSTPTPGSANSPGGDTGGDPDSDSPADTDTDSDSLADTDSDAPADSDSSADTDSPADTAAPAMVAVVLNEFLPDADSTDDGKEWVELKNTDSVSAELEGWVLQKRTSSSWSNVETLTTFTLAPGAYAVIGGTALSPDFVNDKMEMGNATSSGDAIRLLDDLGRVVDTVVYGPNNDDGIPDDDGNLDQLAPKPAEDQSVARQPDGADTDDCSADFVLDPAPTRGSANPSPPVDTDTDIDSDTVSGGDTATEDTNEDDTALPALAEIVINEFLADGESTDDGKEWVELKNIGQVSVGLDGMLLQKRTSSTWSTVETLNVYDLEPGSYVLIGGTTLPGVTFVNDKMELGNASSSGDAIRLLDAFGRVLDTVVYGPNNDDGIEDDDGDLDELAPQPEEAQSLARIPDGIDTDDSNSDFQNVAAPTPGSANLGASDDTGDTSDSDDTGVGSPTGLVLVNELLVDPDSTDEGNEWVEILNADSVPLNLEGWSLERGTSSVATIYVFGNVDVAPGEYLVVGDEFTSADLKLPSGDSLGMGNGTDGDMVRIVNPSGDPVDTVVYGNNNDDAWTDDTGALATSIAPDPGSAEVLARIPDGVDTDQSGVDFLLVPNGTPGAENFFNDTGIDTGEPAPVVCGDPANVSIKINEFIADPAGDDADYEWVELYNSSLDDVDLSGWQVQTGTQSFSEVGVIKNDTILAAGGFLVVGRTKGIVPEVDTVADGFDIHNANATGADGIRLADCDGIVVDTVIYGGDNSTDEWVDDTGSVASSLAPPVQQGVTLMRKADGVDTNLSGDDFQSAPYPTPGYSNTAPPIDCGGPTSGLVVNEFMPDPDSEGGDEGYEWVELYHGGSETLDLDGWSLQAGGSSYSTAWTWEGATPVEPGSFLLVGGIMVGGTDVVADPGLANATSNADAVRILDCKGFAADTVVYGSPNDDGWVDDGGAVAVSLAPKPATGFSLARIQDGFDTNLSGTDFVVAQTNTPGAANPEIEPIVCEPSEGQVVINEILTDPDGTDEGFEFVELYNRGLEDVSVAGWQFSAGTTDYESMDFSIGSGVSVPAGGFLVIGGEFVPGADVVVAMELGNGTDGDGVRLFDCEGNTVDTVVYGDEDNLDGMLDDRGEVPTDLPDPGTDQAVARVADGVDTDSVEDWKMARPTPGATNVSNVTITPDKERLCGCNRQGPPDADAPDADAPEARTDTGKGCSTVPLPFGGLELVALLVALRRRS